MEAAVKRALLPQQLLHLADLGAAEDELGAGVVLLLLDRRLDCGQHRCALGPAGGEEVLELVDHDEDLAVATEPEEEAKEVGHVGDCRPQPKRPLERCGQLPQLVAWRPALGHQHDGRLSVRERPEEP